MVHALIKKIFHFFRKVGFPLRTLFVLGVASLFAILLFLPRTLFEGEIRNYQHSLPLISVGGARSLPLFYFPGPPKPVSSLEKVHVTHIKFMILAETDGVFVEWVPPLAVFPSSVPASGPARIGIVLPSLRSPWEFQMTVHSIEFFKIGPISFVIGNRIDTWRSDEIPAPAAPK